jgi:hypothetical protein
MVEFQGIGLPTTWCKSQYYGVLTAIAWSVNYLADTIV